MSTLPRSSSRLTGGDIAASVSTTVANNGRRPWSAITANIAVATTKITMKAIPIASVEEAFTPRKASIRAHEDGRLYALPNGSQVGLLSDHSALLAQPAVYVA